MPFITALKVETVINLMIDGNVYQKKCETKEQADEFFKLAIAAKNGNEQDFQRLMMELNRINRILVNGVLETDQSGEFFLPGFNLPVPKLLVETMLEYTDKGYPLEAITNFWKLLMLNPDKQIREDLFKFLSHYQFAITDNGYFTAYKVVRFFSKGLDDEKLVDFITERYEKLKSWKKAPRNYSVHKTADEENKYITVINQEVDSKYELIGNLEELYKRIEAGNFEQSVYTDKHNGTTRIILGQPVRKERKHEPHLVECSSNGLHAGSTPYVTNFYNPGDIVLTVLINPAHVIHVPTSESTKLRTAEYYPFAVLEQRDDVVERTGFGKFKVINQPYFETDYATFEKVKIEEDLARVRQDEQNDRQKTEYQIDYKKLLETRLVDLTSILNK
jgi:hypothetical protein